MANVKLNNQSIIKGRLGKDVVLRSTKDNKPVCNLSVAVSNDWFNEDTKEWVQAEPTWISVVLWGNLAERYANLGRGELVRVTGSLSTRKRTLTKEVQVGTGKSAKTQTVEFEVTETHITATGVEVIPTASNSQVAYSQSPAMAEPDF
jgi:single stranded DNA-binding protein